MTHYKLLERDPSALITINGSEPKVYQGNVIYLNNGDNFEVRLFNPLQQTIGAEIILNGQKRDEGLIILKPGQKITLDRFIGESRKMVFETYKIDANDSDAVKAAALNGSVEIKFYHEDFPILTNNWAYSSSMSGSSTPRGGLPHFTNSKKLSKSRGIGGSSLSSEPNYKFCTSSYSSPGVFTSDVDMSQSFGVSSTAYSDYVSESIPEKEVETGRIEKGDVSEQQLKAIDMRFKSDSFYQLHFELKPISAVPVTVSEIRHYCTECGYRMRKQNWKFCPACGTKN